MSAAQPDRGDRPPGCLVAALFLCVCLGPPGWALGLLAVFGWAAAALSTGPKR